MAKKTFLLVILLILLSFSFPSPCTSESNDLWWDENWSFREELTIPINTQDQLAVYQPIDTYITFSSPCWAKNETAHSIRVVFQDEETIIELESQIYGLEYSDANHINACSIVFLIPKETTGNEKYYVYYDDEEKMSPGYPDHVAVMESYYRYEPIPGYPFESHYFKVTQHGFIVYGVAFQGEFLGYSTAHQITKFKEKTKNVTSPKNAEAWASFDYFYYYGQTIEEFSSTIQSLLSKQILIDGNLMVKFTIVSGTPKKDIQTMATYTYYYCPTEHKRIQVHVKHEALKEMRIGMESDLGNIAGLQTGLMRSPSIDELNFGRMFPYMHVYAEDNVIKEYLLDPDPEYTPEGIPVLTVKDDVDLGENAWASFDDGETGGAHAIIFASHEDIVSGTEENDGVQVQALEGSTPGLLGLETDLITFYFSRNAFEKNSQVDLLIPNDFKVEYDAEFFSTYSGGYTAVNTEANMFQSLMKIHPSIGEQLTYEETKEEETFTITAYLHLAPSMPMGTSLSLLTGKNISYITGELYQNGQLIATDIAERLGLNPLSGTEDETLLGKLKTALHIFDWRNLSFFKKIRFQNLKPGTYLIKIYRENPLLGENRKFIGFKIVEVNDDISIHLPCSIEGSVKVTVTDQQGSPVNNAKVSLLYDNIPISEIIVSPDEKNEINAPCLPMDTYVLRVWYKGFIVHEESIRLGYIRGFFPVMKNITFSLFDFHLRVLDTWGLPLAYKPSISLTSESMASPVYITPESVNDSLYLFTNIYPAPYRLHISYKSFSYDEDFEIPLSDDELVLVFPAEFATKIFVSDARGFPLKHSELHVLRETAFKQMISDDQGFSQISLPPGQYTLEVFHDESLIGRRQINIIGERTIDLVTIEESSFPFQVGEVIGIFFVIGAILTLRKKQYTSFLKLVAATLGFLSLVLPWWMIQGFSSKTAVETTTTMYILPPSLITLTTTPTVIGGEQGLDFLPDTLLHLLHFFPFTIAFSSMLVLLSIIFERLNKKKLTHVFYMLPLFLLAGCLTLFYYGFSTITKLGIGSFFGGGIFYVNVPGESVRIATNANWGPGIGFYLCVISFFFLVIFFFQFVTRWRGKDWFHWEDLFIVFQKFN